MKLQLGTQRHRRTPPYADPPEGTEGRWRGSRILLRHVYRARLLLRRGLIHGAGMILRLAVRRTHTVFRVVTLYEYLLHARVGEQRGEGRLVRETHERPIAHRVIVVVHQLQLRGTVALSQPALAAIHVVR